MTCTNIASLPYVVVLLTALLVRTLRPPGARVDTPYGRGCQVARSAPKTRPIGTATAAEGGDLGVESGPGRLRASTVAGRPRTRRQPPPAGPLHCAGWR